MRKVLLSSAALVALAATPAMAEDAINLELGGWFLGYAAAVDQDTGSTYTGSAEERGVDFLRSTEIHFTGETTLDNGLTVGYHAETEADGDNADDFQVEESYMYMSGGWGRINFGEEDGAAYLLQVAAPSADENLDGISQQIDVVNYDLMFAQAGLLRGEVGNAYEALEQAIFTDLDYGQDPTGKATKLTYLTPVLNGFQGGLSYTPDVDAATRDTVTLDDVEDAFGEAYEVALRYEGQWNELGFAVGGGYSHVELERDADGATADDDIYSVANNIDLDDRQVWNVGVDMDYGPFGFGIVYREDNQGYDNNTDEDTLVVGVDYTTGPFRLGASWLTQDNEVGPNNGDIETDRYTGGVVYTYGPGMTFRGSVSYIEHDMPVNAPNNGDDVEATSILLGTQLKF